MGIKGFFSNLRKHHPDLFKLKKLKQFNNSTFFIDSSVFFYKFMTAMRYLNPEKDYISEFKDDYGNKTAHLIGIAGMVRISLQNKVNPVFVFDGKPSELKEEEVR